MNCYSAHVNAGAPFTLHFLPEDLLINSIIIKKIRKESTRTNAKQKPEYEFNSCLANQTVSAIVMFDEQLRLFVFSFV